MKRVIFYALLLVLLTVIVAGGLLVYGFVFSNSELGLTKSDKAFIAQLEQHLKEPGDTVRVSDVHPGEWTLVCAITGYERPSRVVAAALLSDEKQLQFVDSHDYLASDDLWGFAFVTGTTVEYRQVSSTAYYSGGSDGCARQGEALFSVEDIQKTEIDRLNLFKQ